MIRFRYLLVYAHVLLVRPGVDAVPLVDVDPRDVLPGIILEIVGNKVVMAQRRRLNGFLMLLLDSYMLLR